MLGREELSKEVANIYDGQITVNEISFDMDRKRLTDLLNKYEGLSLDNLSKEETCELFSYLIKSNMISVHSFYISKAHELIQEGLLDIYGNIL